MNRIKFKDKKGEVKIFTATQGKKGDYYMKYPHSHLCSVRGIYDFAKRHGYSNHRLSK